MPAVGPSSASRHLHLPESKPGAQE
jgi:hypothetical protein